MLACPNCAARLARVVTPNGVVYQCSNCAGRMVGVGVLRKDRAAWPFVNAVWRRAYRGPHNPGRRCAHCGRPMAEVSVSVSGQPAAIDVCRACYCVWFDPREFEAVPAAPPTEKTDDLSPEAKKRLAMLKVRLMAEMSARAETDPNAPEDFWQLAPAVFGLPFEHTAPPLSRRPFVTWGILAVAAVVFFLTYKNIDSACQDYGFIPSQWFRYGGFTLLSSFFLHGGVWHLVSNLYFLLIFGDNVEDHLGKGRFLLLLALSHLAGMLVHGLFGGSPDVPCVGASAGISGVVTYYAIAFPHAQIGFMIFFRFIRVSAISMLAFYFVIQTVGVWSQISGASNVSALAHLGGMVVGAAAALRAMWIRRLESARA